MGRKKGLSLVQTQGRAFSVPGGAELRAKTFFPESPRPSCLQPATCISPQATGHPDQDNSAPSPGAP